MFFFPEPVCPFFELFPIWCGFCPPSYCGHSFLLNGLNAAVAFLKEAPKVGPSMLVDSCIPTL
jgi:hypothetical protein